MEVQFVRKSGIQAKNSPKWAGKEAKFVVDFCRILY